MPSTRCKRQAGENSAQDSRMQPRKEGNCFHVLEADGGNGRTPAQPVASVISVPVASVFSVPRKRSSVRLRYSVPPC